MEKPQQELWSLFEDGAVELTSVGLLDIGWRVKRSIYDNVHTVM